ncbi:MAG: hypothetical protein R3C56_02910 [Pirellulaceae bacterium]
MAASEGKGFPAFHDVPVGPCAPRVNSSGCQGCYSPDYCECGQGCGGQRASGQCSDGLHGGHPSADMGSSYGHGGVPSAYDPQASFPSAPTALGVSDGSASSDAATIDVGYVVHTAYQTSYEELFAKGIAEEPHASVGNSKVAEAITQ